MRLAGPDSFLLTSRPDYILNVSRITPGGETMWTASTGLRELRQVLPGVSHTAFVGQLPPRVPDEFRPMTLVVIDNATGAVSSHALDSRN